VRTPEEVEGDLEAMIAANARAAQQLATFIARRGSATLERLSQQICDASESAMRVALEAVPDGVYESEWTADGLGRPITLRARLKVAGSDIHISFPEAPPQVEVGAFNCTLSYVRGHVNYALKCILGPEVPTNEGCFRPIHVSAPEGSLFNARRPAAVDMRTRIGWQIHPLIFKALAEVLPGRVLAGCGQPALVSLDGEWRDGRRFQEHLLLGAGLGAGREMDGESNSTFPSSAASTSIEVFEQRSPLLVERRELARESAGAGRRRGGYAERISVRMRPETGRWFRLVVALERMTVAPYGLEGGLEGTRSQIERWRGGVTMDTAERVIEVNDSAESVSVTTAGGGGYGAGTS
jgi:5-oxoprolinase (ATP-hydrolysing)